MATLKRRSTCTNLRVKKPRKEDWSVTQQDPNDWNKLDGMDLSRNPLEIELGLQIASAQPLC